MKKVDKFAVEEAILLLTDGAGRFRLSQLVDILEKQGFDFGEGGDLIQSAKFQKVRDLISRIQDKNGKRKYVSTTTQMSLDFGAEYLYCPAEIAASKKEDVSSLTDLISKRVLGNLRRYSIVPEWVVREITVILERWRKTG